ncbi:MAG: FMN-binding protein [Clostridia bacterium]|nr:FMN-binding protein [Clostridia bacterium]
MTLFLDIVFAWIALGLAVLLSIIIVLRVLRKKVFKSQNSLINKLDRGLRKFHKPLGISIIVVGLYHGLFSTVSVFSVNLGTATWILTILLALTWLLKKQLKKVKNWMFWHRVLTLVFVAVLILHIIDVGGFIGVKTAYQISFTQETQPLAIEAEQLSLIANQTGNVYQDGTYTGVADGFRPGLTVEVTVKDNMITDVKVVSHNEQKSMFYATPIEVIPAEIVNNQTPLVDSISGATYTSYGIINATINALSQAVISGESFDVQTPEITQHIRKNLGRNGNH